MKLHMRRSRTARIRKSGLRKSSNNFPEIDLQRKCALMYVLIW